MGKHNQQKEPRQATKAAGIPKLNLHVIAVFYRIDIPRRIVHTLSDEHSQLAWVAPAKVGDYDVTADTIRALEAMAQ